ncbi:MAG: hypothetical protein IPG96_15615 [Proteobacteria bacterium]|nr:hypothetical protein [Pseudomonadota bacterium]
MGAHHGCGVQTAGTLACWGDNAEGATTPPTGRFSSVASGYYFSCGLRADTQALACWGRNDYGQAVPPPGAFSSVSVGYEHACGVRVDGSLVCWGNIPGPGPRPRSGSSPRCRRAIATTVRCNAPEA